MSMDDTIAGPGGSDRRLTVAEYVLGVLEEPERTAIARAIERDPAMAGEARFWEDHFADLNAAYEEVSPPAGIRSALERRLFGAPAKARWYDSVAFWRGTAAAALAVAVIGIGLNVLSPVVAPVPGAERALLAALAAEDVDLNVFALYEPDAEVVADHRRRHPCDPPDRISNSGTSPAMPIRSRSVCSISARVSPCPSAPSCAQRSTAKSPLPSRSNPKAVHPNLYPPAPSSRSPLQR